MNYSYYDLHHLHGGEIVEVTLSHAANVFLVDSSNYQSFKSGRPYRYYGGQATRSPVRLNVPSAGHWYLVINLGGYGGSVRHSMRILPGLMKPIQEQPLASMPSLVRENRDFDDEPPVDDSIQQYDVFISHASEDKEEIVRPLAETLRSKGLSVWYDEFELKIGDSLRRKIDKGIANSRFGIVVISRAFIGRGWPEYELDGIITRSVTAEQVLLPIWHNVTKKEVIAYSPSLADKLARSTATHTVEEISDEIHNLISGSA